MTKEECTQLKNINYQSMLLKRNSNIASERLETYDVSKYLSQEQEGKGNRQKPWNKLEKSTKLIKIYDYIKDFSNKFNLSEIENIELKKYMRLCLERKKLQRKKDVIYESVLGIIKDIPGLSFNIKKRVFQLRKIDKKVSTLKKIANKNSRTKRKKKTSDKSRKKKNKRKSKTRGTSASRVKREIKVSE